MKANAVLTLTFLWILAIKWRCRSRKSQYRKAISQNSCVLPAHKAARYWCAHLHIDRLFLLVGQHEAACRDDPGAGGGATCLKSSRKRHIPATSTNYPVSLWGSNRRRPAQHWTVQSKIRANTTSFLSGTPTGGVICPCRFLPFWRDMTLLEKR